MTEMNLSQLEFYLKNYRKLLAEKHNMTEVQIGRLPVKVVLNKGPSTAVPLDLCLINDRAGKPCEILFFQENDK
jgi:hypothetical protein